MWFLLFENYLYFITEIKNNEKLLVTTILVQVRLYKTLSLLVNRVCMVR